MTWFYDIWPLGLLLVGVLDAEAALLTSILLVAAGFTSPLPAASCSAAGVLLARWLLLAMLSGHTQKRKPQNQPNPYTITGQGHEVDWRREVRAWLIAQIPTDNRVAAFKGLLPDMSQSMRGMVISAAITLSWLLLWIYPLSAGLATLLSTTNQLIAVRLHLPGWVLLSLICGTVLRMIVHRFRVRLQRAKD